MKSGKRPIASVVHDLAEAMLPIALQFQRSEPPMQRYLNRSAAWMVRELAEFFQVPMNASVKATDFANGRDLRSMTWQQQRNELDPKRANLHYEHAVEVGAITQQVLAATSKEEIVTILNTYRICWILKSENEKLTKVDKSRVNSGGPKRRGSLEWEEAYRAAGIILQYDW